MRQFVLSTLASAIQMKTTAIISPKERFNLVFDHPFLVAIADTKTGVIVFLGIIADPKT
jgi:serine protease inhibitor